MSGAAKLESYEGKVAVVTGASSGIGAELARQLAARGMAVGLVARRRERLEALAQEIGERGGRARVQPCDVSSRKQVEEAHAEIARELGPVDLLLNGAGYVRHVLFKDHDLDDIERMTQTNYLGTVYWIKQVLPGMRQNGAGWIVNVSSFAGLLPQPDEAAYSASKCAVTGLSDALVHELAPLGIHVMAVHPGLVRTEMFTPEIMERMPKGSEKRFVEADDFGRQLLAALEKGETQIVIPRPYRIACLVKALAPGWSGRSLARQRLSVLGDVTR